VQSLALANNRFSRLNQAFAHLPPRPRNWLQVALVGSAGFMGNAVPPPLLRGCSYQEKYVKNLL
jgi:hypothetical protein